ncbi:MFS transporter [Terrimonas sp.]|uniref:MFS transporter n=1 Tax=Terrimonas sp. TaxID=1914338 RepID=UPI000D50859E|nr:MFS transporter [Terrimonas sp.]PVD53834.1 MFS transporter [Terrimonas sp.]
MNLTLSFSTQRYYRIGVSTFYFIQGITFATWASRIPDIQKALNLSDGLLGSVLFALPVGQITAMALSGYLVSRFGSKKILSIAACLYPAVLLLLGSVTSLWQLVGALFFFGICGNLSNISLNTQGVGVERLYRRSIMASFHGVWSMAGFAGGLISAYMVADNIPVFTHFCIVYALGFILMLAARKFMLPRDAHYQQASQKQKIFVKPDRYIITLGIIAFACMICEGTMFDWSGIYFEKVVNAPKDLTRLGYVAFMFTMTAGRFTADWLVTRFGVHRVLQSSGIFIITGMMLAILFPYVGTATAGFLLVGIGTSSVVPMAYSLAGKSKTMVPSVALAAVSSIGFLGFLIGPPIIGFISELSNLRVSFTLVAILGLGTTIMAGRLK